MVVTVIDASLAQETVLEANGTEKPHRIHRTFVFVLG